MMTIDGAARVLTLIGDNSTTSEVLAALGSEMLAQIHEADQHDQHGRRAQPVEGGQLAGAVHDGQLWRYVAHATAGDRTQIIHRLDAQGRELDQMTAAGFALVESDECW